MKRAHGIGGVCILVVMLLYSVASAQDASPVASPIASPVATPNLLATIQANQTATAEAQATATAAAEQMAAAQATETAMAEASATSAAQTAVVEAATEAVYISATATAYVAEAEATIAALSSENAELETALVAVATSQAGSEQAAADAQATSTALSNQLADLQATIDAEPTPTPIPTSTPTPVPTPTPTPTPPTAGTVLYSADESDGFEQWSGAGVTQLNGMLVFTGTADDMIILPVPVDWYPVSDYTVEIEVQIVKGSRCTFSSHDGFGIYARRDGGNTGYSAGYRPCSNENRRIGGIWMGIEGGVLAKKQAPPVDSEWHTYRIEVRGNEIRYFVDGSEQLVVADNRFLQPGQAGLWVDAPLQLNVRSFTVTAI